MTWKLQYLLEAEEELESLQRNMALSIVRKIEKVMLIVSIGTRTDNKVYKDSYYRKEKYDL